MILSSHTEITMAADVVLVPLHAIVVHRGNSRVTPRIGVAFQFTAEEAESILRKTPYGVRRMEDPPEVDERLTAARVEPLPGVESARTVRPSGIPLTRPSRRPAAATRDDSEI